MTLLERNTFFKAGIVFCFIVSILVISASFLIVPVYSEMEEIPQRPAFFFQSITGWFLNSSFLAVHFSLVLAVLFSFIGMLLIHSFFERTSVPEILYISLFTISLSFEIIRLMLPLHFINNFPIIYLLGTSRALLFARYFGLFSLFIAGACAAGLEVHKTRNIILVLIIITVFIVLGIPIDAQTWDTSFKLASGYSFMFRMIETVTFIVSVLTFFVAAKVRDSREYFHVGVGIIFALAGRNILIGTDNWIGPVLGILFLSFGTWFICSKLHKIHLWL